MRKGLLIIFSFLFAIISHAQTANDTTTFTSEMVQARFPGGAEAWSTYLQHNLKAELGAKYIHVKKHQTVRQTAMVSFIVNKEGKISEVIIVNPAEVHPKLAAEAVRVIKEGPDWLPATINDKPVLYRQRQAIIFEVSGE